MTGEIEAGRQHLEISEYDRHLYGRLLGRAERVSALAERYRDRLPTIDGLMADIFAAFYRSAVRLAGEDQVDPTYGVNRHFVERLLASAAYRRLHPATEGRPDDSLLCLEAFTRRFAESLNEEMISFINAEYNFHNRRAQLDDEREALAEFHASGKRGRPRGDAEAEEELAGRPPSDMSATQRRRRMEQIDSDIEKLDHDYRRDYERITAAENFGANLKEANLPSSLSEVDDQLAKFNHALALWGAESTEGSSELSLDEKLDLFSRFESDIHLQRITALLGRMRFAASAAHKQKPDARPQTLAEVKYGNDLARLLPTEAALLGDEATETLFIRKFAERQLLVYGLEGQPPDSRGPIIFCLDESRSMLGQRDIAAKALAMAMMTVARADGRDLAIVHFASANQLKVQEFAGGHGRPLDVVEVLGHFFDGGTDFDVPLNAAMDLAERRESFAKADIVMITDGEALVSQKTRERLASVKIARGTRLFAVCVGTLGDIFADLAERVWSGVDLEAESDNPVILRELVGQVHRDMQAKIPSSSRRRQHNPLRRARSEAGVRNSVRSSLE